MTLQILTGGLIKASPHGVFMPSTPGLSRVSEAIFFAPFPETVLDPPVEYTPSISLED